MPKGYIIAHITVTDPEAYKEYVRRDSIIFARYGATFPVRGGRATSMEGEAAQRHVVVEFPDYDTALACYNDPEYQEVAEIRRAAAMTHLLAVCEGAD